MLGMLLLFIHILFTLIGVWQRPIPLRLRASQLDGGAPHPLPKNENSPPPLFHPHYPREPYSSPPPEM